MARYAIIDAKGLPQAFYADDIHEQIPTDAIMIPDADWQAHISGDLRRWDGQAWVPYTPPPPPLAEVQAQAEQQLNIVAEEQRRKWLPAPGQAITYMEKERQARDFAAAGYPANAVPPLVQAEVDARDGRISPRFAADEIIAAADAVRAALTAIECERRRGVLAIRAARDADEVRLALQIAISAIKGVK